MKTFRGVFPLGVIRNDQTGEELAVLAFIDEHRLYVQRTVVIRCFLDWLKQEDAHLVSVNPRELKHGDVLRKSESKQHGAFHVEAIARDDQGEPDAVVVAQKFILNDPKAWSLA